MTDTVTVFVRLMPEKDPGVPRGDIRVYSGDVPPGMTVTMFGWVRFNEVPIQTFRTDDETTDEEREVCDGG